MNSHKHRFRNAKLCVRTLATTLRVADCHHAWLMAKHSAHGFITDPPQCHNLLNRIMSFQSAHAVYY